MITTCCVYDCPGSVPPQPDDASSSAATFHQFPIGGDPARLAEWCDLLQIDADSADLGEMFVCQRHFSPQQYDFSSEFKKTLKVDAVPDHNLPKIVREDHLPPKDESKLSACHRNTEDRFNPPVLVVDDLGKVCRLCLETDEQATHETLFAKEDIVEFIVQSIGIEVQPNDGYPQMICQTCIERVTYIHRSREWFHKNDQFLKALVGELSNETPVEPTQEDEPVSTNKEPVMEETVELLDSGLIEAEEITLEEMGVKAEESDDDSSDDEPLVRKKQRQRRCSGSPENKSIGPLDARSDLIKECYNRGRTMGKFWCVCNASYKELKRLCRHIWEDHDSQGRVKPKRAKMWASPLKVPANPLLLEQMAAVFNGLNREPEPPKKTRKGS